jgi:hypothetical protein
MGIIETVKGIDACKRVFFAKKTQNYPELTPLWDWGERSTVADSGCRRLLHLTKRITCDSFTPDPPVRTFTGSSRALQRVEV